MSTPLRIEVRYCNGDGSHGLDSFLSDGVSSQMSVGGRTMLRLATGPVAWVQYAQAVRIIARRPEEVSGDE